MRKPSLFTSGAVAVLATTTVLGSVSPASADVYPQAGDVVGTGSDTLQVTADFIFEGTPGGAGGYNLNKTNRAFSFDATADANGRAVYSDAGAPGGILPATSVLRSGSKPVVRPNGSGAGVDSLYKGEYVTLSGTQFASGLVDFARSSSLPTCVRNTNALNAGTGGLHVYKFATEALALAVPITGSNAPSGGIIGSDLVSIYKGDILTWNQLTGNAAGSTSTIIPQIPQTGSGTRNSFEADLKALNGGVTVPLSNPNVQVVQENDYTSLTSPTTGLPANVIAPFSGGRIGLNNSGFFGAAAANQVMHLPGTAVATGATYKDNRSLYFVVRENDVLSSNVFQPGGTKNFVRTLFSGSGNVVGSPAFAANIQAAGHTPAYLDTGTPGVAGTSCS